MRNILIFFISVVSFINLSFADATKQRIGSQYIGALISDCLGGD